MLLQCKQSVFHQAAKMGSKILKGWGSWGLGKQIFAQLHKLVNQESRCWHGLKNWNTEIYLTAKELEGQRCSFVSSNMFRIGTFTELKDHFQAINTNRSRDWWRIWWLRITKLINRQTLPSWKLQFMQVCSTSFLPADMLGTPSPQTNLH